MSQKVTSSLGNFSLSDIENSNSLFHALAPTRTVTILIATDEEYRVAHPDWKTITAQMVEKQIIVSGPNIVLILLLQAMRTGNPMAQIVVHF